MQNRFSNLLVTIFLLLVSYFSEAVFSQETVVSVPFLQPEELIIEAGSDLLVQEGESTAIGNELKIQGGSRDFLFTWTLPGNQVYTDSVIISGEPGVYHILIRDINNCSDVDSLQVSLVTNTHQNLSDLPFYCFPNPSQGVLNYRIQGLKGYHTLSVISQSGVPVIQYQLNNTGNAGSINLQHLSKGIYLLKLTDGKDSYTMQFILK